MAKVKRYKVDDSDYIFLYGDLNFRVGLPFDTAIIYLNEIGNSIKGNK
jgi:hypothetical protein